MIDFFNVYDVLTGVYIGDFYGTYGFGRPYLGKYMNFQGQWSKNALGIEAS